MSLHTYADLEQRSDEWLDVRRGIVTASVIGQLITPKKLETASNDYSRALTLQLVAERITGWTEEPYVSHDMMRGKLDEPVARGIYAEHYAPVTEVGFMVNDDHGFRIGFSPDGLVGDDGLIEIKSRRPKAHVATVVAGEVPAECMPQIQCGLLVSGRQWCDYVSFCGGMPLWRKRVEPTPAWFDAILAAVESFEQSAAEMVATYQAAVAGLPATERIDHFAEPELKL
ncbi:lambda exonuclease family protein [Streptomyces sp.]|uniref:lambda exonuclease family protein n=1 Tax=Streptomyces sp. TaxID=1931 RepID=UPI002F927005